jgi:hypothetical protein
MRKLLLLLLGLMALGTLMPSAPALAAPMPHHGHAMPPGHCDEGQGAVHICLGCAVDPAKPMAAALPLLERAPLPVVPLVSALEDRRPPFDPPPPRMV